VTPKDRERFMLCLLAAAELYGKPVSDGVSSVWWDALKGYDIGAIENAFRRHFGNPDSGQFMPKPADIVRIVGGSSQDGAMVAWSKVDKAVRQVGPYASVCFDDPLVNRVLHDMGGWIAFGQKTETEWPFVANEFRNRYIGYRQRGEVPDYPARLIGIAEADGARKGFAVPAPKLIGDSLRAQAVLDGGTSAPMIGITTAASHLRLVEK
jgi:hypothetical protein